LIMRVLLGKRGGGRPRNVARRKKEEEKRRRYLSQQTKGRASSALNEVSGQEKKEKNHSNRER